MARTTSVAEKYHLLSFSLHTARTFWSLKNRIDFFVLIYVFYVFLVVVLAGDCFQRSSRSATRSHRMPLGDIKATRAFALPKECTALALFGDPILGSHGFARKCAHVLRPRADAPITWREYLSICATCHTFSNYPNELTRISCELLFFLFVKR